MHHALAAQRHVIELLNAAVGERPLLETLTDGFARHSRHVLRPPDEGVLVAVAVVGAAVVRRDHVWDMAGGLQPALSYLARQSWPDLADSSDHPPLVASRLVLHPDAHRIVELEEQRFPVPLLDDRCGPLGKLELSSLCLEAPLADDQPIDVDRRRDGPGLHLTLDCIGFHNVRDARLLRVLRVLFVRAQHPAD
eukprot:CAMPEP_0197898542 /NCGR_PEP_ID=MMETSP1439-20131203/44296_1 /TAXON_ID=66791 /ORGANISM="Gonyaulax spinifera, Strain CCMP409" /LENGTH=193 /DNA_ID=CAMNT_0043519275 /DNA_START=306 /DNA_END=887 /DNA_ORIENTATION=-